MARDSRVGPAGGGAAEEETEWAALVDRGGQLTASEPVLGVGG